MAKVRFFRNITLALFFLVLLSAASHLVLLTSDNSDYRTWAFVQIGLHLVAATLLLFVRRFSLYALLSLALLSVFIIHIDTRILDYRLPAIAFVISWLGYAVVVRGVWSEFYDSPGAT